MGKERGWRRKEEESQDSGKVARGGERGRWRRERKEEESEERGYVCLCIYKERLDR
jgi:hypothetical protein